VQDWDLWPLWDRISVPTLVIRGADSDLLLPETAEEMTRRGPCARLVTWPGMGHAPALMAQDQIDVVKEWLTAN
jgi:pimeloyl-ACP methyl ester carboxylesterase